MLIGAIIGDIVGSKYEFNNNRTKDFIFFDEDMFFTDDTVMSVAIYTALSKTYKNNYRDLDKEVIKYMQLYGRIYQGRGYGGRFAKWIWETNPQPYNSYGNGSAMRVSSVPYFAKSLEEVKMLSKKVSEVTHNHEEGLKGAEATAVAIYLALQGKNKKEIKKYIEDNYYSMDFDYEVLKETYVFNETCQDTVPQALYCFFESNDFEDAIRIGISIGGDSDTLCAIIGAVAEAYYGIDKGICKEALTYLDDHLEKKVAEAENLEKKLIKQNKRRGSLWKKKKM